MSPRMRLSIFLPFGLLFLALYVYAAKDLPDWGDYRGPYGVVIANLAVFERHSTDVVNAINYDYRAFDTLGEEFILFTAVVGVMLLLRRDDTDDEKMRRVAGLRDRPRLSVTVRAAVLPALLLTLVFGFYLGTHGQLTPGGGFQAGVILASGLLLVYLAENTESFKRIASHVITEVIEAAGATSYALIGVVPLLAGVPLLTNVLPLGQTGDVFSSGTIALISVCVGIEVTAAFLLVTYTYLEEIISGEVPES